MPSIAFWNPLLQVVWEVMETEKSNHKVVPLLAFDTIILIN
jgi:hypothetical protein